MSGIDALAPSPPPPGTDPQTVAAEITAASRTSFANGMRILSRPRREGMWALYAFARIVDDIADGEWETAEKHRLLDAWRAEIEKLYAERPTSAIGQALVPPVGNWDLPKAEFLALIDGMQMDADGPIIAPSREVLGLYTRRVAGTVGLLSMRIFGAWRGEVSEAFALDLADAFQLTNILRDVEEDAAMGRLYLPAEALDRAAIPHHPMAAAQHPRLPQAKAELAAEARAAFDRARSLIRKHNRWALAPALLMLGVYDAYLRRMEATGFASAPLRLSGRQKLWHGLCRLAAP